MSATSSQRPFLLLRYTLIVATAYLVMAEARFALPPLAIVLIIALALTSNVLIAQLPEHLTRSMTFGMAVVVGDTLWITALLLRSGRFNAEFFFLYFFVLLLAAIGENLRLIAVGAVAVCTGYVYLLMASGGTWSMWDSPSLIRIPFLFTAAAFYGYLVDRMRSDRWRAETVELERRRTETALHERTGQLRDEAAVSASLARVGSELISSLDRPVVLERLCQLTADELGCASSHTLLLRTEDDVFVTVASHGLTPELRELARLVEVPQVRIAPLLQRFAHDDVIEIAEVPPGVLPSEWLAEVATHHVLMALRRGRTVVGLQVANWHTAREPLAAPQRRIADGIAHLASMALTNAQLVDELEAANRLKSDFVASMSHELRTPLNLIIGYNDLLLDGIFGPLQPEQSDTLRRVSRSSHELLDLIEATLDLSRLEAKRVPLDLRELDLAALFDELAAETRGWTLQPGVALLWEFSPATPPITTDSVKVRMVLKNLIGNAAKFTADGTITVSARAAGDEVELAVSDTGIGIGREAQAVIFEPFRQADRSVHARYGGAGLGLYIVRRLLELLGGTIGLESQPGRGATFRVLLPVNPHRHVLRLGRPELGVRAAQPEPELLTG